MHLKQLLWTVLLVQFLTCIAIFLDVPIAGQILGFLFLSFIPGIVCLKILRMRELDLVEFVLLSAGLSIAFLMLFGLLINQVYPLFGFSAPLSPLSLIISINLVLLGLLAISFSTKEELSISVGTHFNREFILSTLLVLFFPFLSVTGATFVNFYMNNSILLLLVVLISALVFLIAISDRIPLKLYPIALLAIALALVFHESLTTSYLYGFDIHTEYHLFTLVKNNSFWNNVIPSTMSDIGNQNAMLSVTILPTIFSNFLNLSGVWVFKILYPLIFSFVPLGLYQTYQKRIGKRNAFLAVFFFMSFYAFYRELLSVSRQMIAELFLVLLIFLFLDEKIDKLQKRVLLVVFTVGLVVSHYSTSYVFVFILAFAWLLSVLLKKKTKLTGGYVLLTLLVTFSWAIYTSASSLFNSIVQFAESRFNAFFSEFLNPSSRQTDVLRGIGVGSQAESFGHEVGRYFNYLSELFIIIGFVAIIVMRTRLNKKYDLGREFILFSCGGIVLLLMSIVVPYFASALNVSRIYHLVLLFVAPLFVLGGEIMFGGASKVFRKWAKRVNLTALVTIVLIGCFLFNIGFIYEITGDVPFSNALSMSRVKISSPVDFYSKYTCIGEICGAEWLSRNTVPSSQIYSDLDAEVHVLTSYGMFNESQMTVLSNGTTIMSEGSYVYLRFLNIAYGEMVGADLNIWNTSDISCILEKQNLIYSNGECQIYQVKH